MRIVFISSSGRIFFSIGGKLGPKFSGSFIKRPIRYWSKAAKFCLAQSMTFFLMIMMACPAWALSGKELDELVPVIIMAESSGDPWAIGKGGERGVMQISEAKWKEKTEWGWHKAFDEDKNVLVGRAILEDINNRYARWDVDADRAHIIYTYSTGLFKFGELPKWTKRHPNNIYREIFNG